MIAKLNGRLDSVGDDWAVIDVGGVGYLVQASARTLARLQQTGGGSVLVDTQVGDDRITLYGFADPAEQVWFRLLNGVQGVGARIALNLLSAFAPADLHMAIAADDRRALTRANGVGPRLAARIVNELRERVGGIARPAAGLPGAAAAGAASEGEGDEDAAGRDAVSALVNLGFGRAEAFAAVASVRQSLGAGAALGDLVRAGLKELGR